jgi:hypothetical protein
MSDRAEEAARWLWRAATREASAPTALAARRRCSALASLGEKPSALSLRCQISHGAYSALAARPLEGRAPSARLSITGASL